VGGLENRIFFSSCEMEISFLSYEMSKNHINLLWLGKLSEKQWKAEQISHI
jgi:hypothetical protein